MPRDMYKGKIPIVYTSLNEAFMRGSIPEDLGTGAVPRDFSIDPVEMRDSPDKMVLVKESEWDALYDEGEANEDSLEHIVLRAIEAGEFEFLDQNGFPDCWMHSPAHAVMVDCLVQNLPVPKLNAVTAATMSGRLNGGWCGLGMKRIRDHGIPIVGPDAPYKSRKYNDTPAFRESMKLHRVLEDWYDLSRAEWDQDLSKGQFTTCLFNNLPTPSDYNRYSHSMLSLRWVRLERGLWGPLTLNSWGQFGYKGLCVLANHVPDGSCALRSSTAVNRAA